MNKIAVYDGYVALGKYKRKKKPKSAKGALTPQQKKFKVAAKDCWGKIAKGSIEASPKSLGKCMRGALKKKGRK